MPGPNDGHDLGLNSVGDREVVHEDGTAEPNSLSLNKKRDKKKKIVTQPRQFKPSVLKTKLKMLKSVKQQMR